MSMKRLRAVHNEVIQRLPEPKFRALTFDPSKPCSLIYDNNIGWSFNVGVAGLLAVIACADGARDDQLERVLDEISHHHLREWIPLYAHIRNGTVPPKSNPEQRALLAREYRKNRETYEILRFPEPKLDG